MSELRDTLEGYTRVNLEYYILIVNLDVVDLEGVNQIAVYLKSFDIEVDDHTAGRLEADSVHWVPHNSGIVS